MLAAAVLAGGCFGLARTDGFAPQGLISMLGGALMFGVAALAAMGLVGVLVALVTSGLPSGLDSREEPAPTRPLAGTFAVLAVLLNLAALMLVQVFALGSVLLVFVALVLARVARKHAASGTWPRIVGTVAYFVCTWTLVVALAVRLTGGDG